MDGDAAAGDLDPAVRGDHRELPRRAERDRGGRPRQADTIVIDTDGAIRQIDTLAAAYDNAADTGLTVAEHALDDALDHPTTVARQIGLAALAPACLACGVRDVCGGGYYPHRYRAGTGSETPRSTAVTFPPDHGDSRVCRGGVGAPTTAP